jgi:hypothetical protein
VRILTVKVCATWPLPCADEVPEAQARRNAAGVVSFPNSWSANYDTARPGHLELYRVAAFGDSAPGRVSAHLRSQARFYGRAGLHEFEAELDRSFPKWRDFPGKEKLGRRFFGRSPRSNFI